MLVLSNKGWMECSEQSSYCAARARTHTHLWAGLSPWLQIKGAQPLMGHSVLHTAGVCVILASAAHPGLWLRHVPSQDSTLATRDGMKPQSVIDASTKRLSRTFTAEGRSKNRSRENTRYKMTTSIEVRRRVANEQSRCSLKDAN